MPALVAVQCDDSGVDWQRFNGEDTIDIEITASADVGDPVSSDLFSTTGSVLVGTVSVSPGSGPVGTEHELVVDVVDTWQETVGRVSVETDSGERGLEEFDLERDSADHGLWVVTLQSRGAEGEARTDALSVRLWTEPGVDVPEPPE